MRIIINLFKKTFSNKYNLLLLLLFLFQIIFFIVFEILNKNYPTWDSAGHISLSYRIAEEVKRTVAGERGASIVSILKVSNYYPPLVQIIGAFISLAFGYKYMFLLVETLVFLLISIVFTYKLTLVITKDQKVSLLTACIYSIFPQIIDQSHYLHLDIPLLALLLIALYFLYLSEGFRKFFYTLLFFIFFAFVQITKWYGFVFLLVPILLCIFKGLLNKSDVLPERLKIIRNIFLSSLIFLIIALPWYIANWSELIALVKVFSVGESDDPSTLLQSLAYYPSNMITYQIMFVPFLLLISSILFEVVKNTKSGIKHIFLILIPWAAFIYISNKNLRYILPLTPLFAYLISVIVIRISSKVKGFTFFIILYLVLASTFLSFNQMKKDTPVLKYISVAFTGTNYKAWYHIDPTFYSYKSNRYPSDEILKFIYSDANRVDHSLGVAVLIDSGDISAATLEMLRLENHFNNMYMPTPYFQFEPFKSTEEIEAFFVETASEYVISPTYPGPPGLRNYKALTQCIGYLNSDNNKLFNEIKVFPLPNGEKIKIYKRSNFSENKDITDACKSDAGIVSGVESIKLIPGYTYTMFTGHFAIEDKISRDYEKGVIYILQIENTVHESVLEIHNLPKSGSSLCSQKGLGLDLTEDVKRPLMLENQCGPNTPCTKAILVQWSVGDTQAKVTEFTKDSFK
jgi:4-amino-4-deoxy-L-arabinose transferase-like glycosyltransferase